MELQAKHNREQPRKTQKTAKRPEQNEMKQKRRLQIHYVSVSLAALF